MKIDNHPYIYRYRIPLYEIDLGNAMYHGNYFHLFEIARDDFWRQIGFPYKKIMDLRMHLTIVECQCRYRKPLFYDEEVYIATAVTKVGNRSLSLSQKIFRPPKNELCTEATLNMVCVTFEGKPTRLPAELKKVLQSMTNT